MSEGSSLRFIFSPLVFISLFIVQLRTNHIFSVHLKKMMHIKNMPGKKRCANAGYSAASMGTIKLCGKFDLHQGKMMHFQYMIFPSAPERASSTENKMKTSTTLIATAIAGLLPSLAFASCGAAFCTVNTNWTTQSALADVGSSFDLRYEFIDQDQPYAGSDRIAIGQIPHHHDEVRTLNRNLVATYSHNFGDGWGVTLSAPVGERDHVHVHNHKGAKINEQWKFTELGDVRAVGRYQFASGSDLLKPSAAGVTFGLKLPTGRITVDNEAGSVGERSMQPGSGTTDLLVGAYYHQTLVASDVSWFAQAQYQHALNSRDAFKPGAQFGADIGVRRGFGERLGGLVQLNFVHKQADAGTSAEPADSGGRFVYLSPGLSYAVSSKLQVYGFVQQAVYRHVTGVQLTAARSFLLGVSGRL
jgi:hypothetical protein